MSRTEKNRSPDNLYTGWFLYNVNQKNKYGTNFVTCLHFEKIGINKTLNANLEIVNRSYEIKEVIKDVEPLLYWNNDYS